MPSLHVIYDPLDKVQHDNEVTKRFNICWASIRTDENPGNTVGQMVNDLIRLLLKSMDAIDEAHT